VPDRSGTYVRFFWTVRNQEDGWQDGSNGAAVRRYARISVNFTLFPNFFALSPSYFTRRAFIFAAIKKLITYYDTSIFNMNCPV